MDPKVGLIVQLAGVSLITLLTLFLRRSIKTVALKQWTHAWLFLSFALFCLRLAFSHEQYSLQLFSLYFLTEYIFGFLLVAGCKSLATNSDLHLRHEVAILPFIIVAFGLPFISDDVNFVLNVHSLIMTGFFTAAIAALWRTELRTFGWNVMAFALMLLAVDYLASSAAFAARLYAAVDISPFAYSAVIDMVLQTLLGFGMVIVLLEQVVADAKLVHEQLKRAHHRLEELAHVDPLTAALNRHAFYGYLKRFGDDDQPVHGCVGFFDIDDLKLVNDAHGHDIGDKVIRSVVRAIRAIIRAEDLIFRWGGDEFFVIMVGMEAEMGTIRMHRLESMLAELRFEGLERPLSVGVSYAFEGFADLDDLETTIKRADAGMYRRKQIRKGLIAEDRFDLGTAVLTSEVVLADPR